jgi:uncharacterized protein YndB with AHSA1/START domain
MLMRRLMLLAALFLVAAPLLAEDKGPTFSRKLFIGADAATVWDALVNPDVVKRYHHAPLGGIELKKDGEIWYGTAEKKVLTGKILEVEVGKKLSHTFQFAHRKDEPSRLTYEIEAMDAMCSLSLTHDQFGSETETYKDISTGWDAVLSNLKTLLETGDVLPWPESEGPREEVDLKKAQIIELPSSEDLPGQFETFKFDTTGAGEHGWGAEVERGEVAVQKGYALSFNCSDKITNAQFALLKSIPRLGRLNISYCEALNDNAFRALSSMVDLRELYINAQRVSDRGLRGVSALKNLEAITLVSCPNLTGEFLRLLPAPEKMRRVAFTWMKVNDATFAALTKCSKLRTLRFSDCPEVTDAGVANLKIMTELEQLVLPSRCAITDAGLACLSGMTSLQSLSISGLEGFKGAGFAHIGKLESLDTLEISYCENLESPAADTFAASKSLRQVTLSNCAKLDDKLLAALTKCPQLSFISITEIGVTDKGIASLSALAKLSTLYCTSLALTDEAAKSIGAMPSISQLWLDYCQGISDAGIKHLVALKNLRELGLRGSEKLTDTCLDEFKEFPALTSLTLYGCKKITKEGVEKLRAAKPKLWVSFD